MTDPEMLTWLRRAVTERLELARKATQVPWEAEGDDPTDDEVWIDVDGEAWRMVICRGPQSHENMLHVAANDPQDTIARCEAELGILDEHRIVVADHGLPEQGQSCGSARGYRIVHEFPTEQQIADAPMMWHNADCRTCRARPPCRTVSLLAAGYKHRPGYREEWKP